MELWELDATAASDGMLNGRFSSTELVQSCLQRIEALEPEVQAWTYLDPAHALTLARHADELRESGADLGPLHGVPVGVKDIIDTRDMPTECGTPVMADRQPSEDAAVVTLLREAGAIVMGKTVTTEVAAYSPGKTRNPHDTRRTPGGSSSGSAAAVASSMVPLAVGSQTNGSVIRPASYCGVVGYKPTHGRVSRHGVMAQSRHLDTIGFFARSLEDVAMVAEPLMAFDARDADMRLRPRPHLRRVVASEPPVDPKVAFVKTSVWDQASADCQAAFAELADWLGDQCDEVQLPGVYDQAIERHRTIMLSDFAKSFAGLYDAGKDRLSDMLVEQIEEGRTYRAMDYNRALDMAAALNVGLEELFESFDAIVTPATTGEAPVGLDATGSPVFCTLWTLLGVPSVTLPLLEGGESMPIGVQVVGPRDDDSRLLRTARWLVDKVKEDE